MNTQVIHTSKTWVNNQANSKPDLLRIYGPKYPHFRFSCPACGSLDVFVSLQIGSKCEGKCLDCNHDWKEMPR